MYESYITIYNWHGHEYVLRVSFLYPKLSQNQCIPLASIQSSLVFISCPRVLYWIFYLAILLPLHIHLIDSTHNFSNLFSQNASRKTFFLLQLSPRHLLLEIYFYILYFHLFKFALIGTYIRAFCSRIYKTSQESSELSVILFPGHRSFPVSSPGYFPFSSP